MSFDIRKVPAASPDASLLMDALDADLQNRYPGALINGIDGGRFDTIGGIFLVGYDDGMPVACGALRPWSDRCFEVKRMFVVESARHRGHARALLAALEAHARERGVAVIRLETGDGQPEAIRLYESAGYQPIRCYGEYAGSPHSRCFEKQLSPLNRVP